MSTLKPARDYLQELPNPYRDAILAQCPQHLQSIPVYGLLEAIAGIGHSVELREGYSFWSRVYMSYLDRKELPAYPKELKNKPVLAVGKLRENINRHRIKFMQRHDGYCDGCGEYIPWVASDVFGEILCSDCCDAYRGRARRSCNMGRVELTNIQYNGSQFLAGEW